MPRRPDGEISRFPFKERLHMPGSQTTPGRCALRLAVAVAWPSAWINCVGTQIVSPFAAQWLACALPCQTRFADALTGPTQGSGPMRVANPYLAADLHRLLLAG
jgi:hypothetical protein